MLLSGFVLELKAKNCKIYCVFSTILYQIIKYINEIIKSKIVKHNFEIFTPENIYFIHFVKYFFNIFLWQMMRKKIKKEIIRKDIWN